LKPIEIRNIIAMTKVADQESGRKPVKIPEILIERLKPFGARFIKIAPPIAGDKNSGKRAVEKGFQNHPYEADDPELQNWLARGGNYGILGGRGITFIETDDKRMTKRIDNRYKTFTVRSGGGGKHFAFISDITENGILLDPKTNENLGNIQADRRYIVGANCHHFTGGVYKVIDDSPIVYISKKEVEEIFKDYLVWTGQKRKELEKQAIFEQEQAGATIPLRDLIDLDELGALNENELQGSHPIHGSMTGQNFCVNLKKNVWHCFRCNSGGGGLMWIAVENKILKCHEAQAGALRGEKFFETIKIAQEMGFEVGLKEERTEPDVERFFIDNPNGTKSFVCKWVANELMKEHTYATQREGRVLFVYNPSKGIYEKLAEQQIEETVEKKIGRHASIHRRKEIIGHIKVSTYKNLEDAPKEIIAVKNGLLSKTTRKIQSFTPDYFIINKIPIEFNLKAKCPNFLKFLSEVVSKKDAQTLQEFTGFTVGERNYKYQMALMLLGDGGNGKTTWLNVLIALLGESNCAHESLQYLMINRFALGQLFGKLANIYDDLPSLALRNVGFFKMLTGEGTLTAEFKFQDRFPFKNYAKMVFTCNVIPPCPEDTAAFFRRWIIINFPNCFIGREDPDLTEKLTTPEELSGILNWALDGLDRLHKNKRFTLTGTVEEVRARYLASAEPVKSFAENRLEVAEGNKISKDVVYQAYRDYCKKLGIKVVEKASVSRQLPSFIRCEGSQQKVAGKKIRVWLHIKLSDTVVKPTIKGTTLDTLYSKKGGVLNNDTHKGDKKRVSGGTSAFDAYVEEHAEQAEEPKKGVKWV